VARCAGLRTTAAGLGCSLILGVGSNLSVNILRRVRNRAMGVAVCLILQNGRRIAQTVELQRMVICDLVLGTVASRMPNQLSRAGNSLARPSKHSRHKTIAAELPLMVTI
jgi:hypothetical protein